MLAERHGGVQGVLELILERPAQREQRRLPLPALVDPWKATVVELVEEIERELKILVAQRIARTRRRHLRERAGLALKGVEQQLGDWSPRWWKPVHAAA